MSPPTKDAALRRNVDRPLPSRDDFGPLPRGIHHLGMTVPDIDAATTFLRAAWAHVFAMTA